MNRKNFPPYTIFSGSMPVCRHYPYTGQSLWSVPPKRGFLGHHYHNIVPSKNTHTHTTAFVLSFPLEIGQTDLPLYSISNLATSRKFLRGQFAGQCSVNTGLVEVSPPPRLTSTGLGTDLNRSFNIVQKNYIGVLWQHWMSRRSPPRF